VRYKKCPTKCLLDRQGSIGDMVLDRLPEQIGIGRIPVAGDTKISGMTAELMLQFSRIEYAKTRHASPSVSYIDIPSSVRYPRHCAAVCTMETTSCVLLTMSEIRTYSSCR
jgi:hypothetical protein